jgi:hypothetical protein
MEKLYIPSKDGCLLELANVPGDGNCFFHEVVLSDLVNISDHQVLRSFLVDRVYAILSDPTDHDEVLSLFQHVSVRTKPTTWLDKMKQANTWGDDCAALFISYLFQINIQIISNTAGGLFYNDMRL